MSTRDERRRPYSYMKATERKSAAYQQYVKAHENLQRLGIIPKSEKPRPPRKS